MNKHFDGYRITYGLVVMGITYGLVVVGITYELVVMGITYELVVMGITYGLVLPTDLYFVGKLPTPTLHTDFCPWEFRR